MNEEPATEVVQTISRAMKASQLPPIDQIFMIFLLGGTVVVVATLAGKMTQNPYVSGILLCFPAMLISGTLAFHLTGESRVFISEFLMGTIPGLAIAASYAVVGHYSFRHLDFWVGMSLALLGWLVFAAIGVAIHLHR